MENLYIWFIRKEPKGCPGYYAGEQPYILKSRFNREKPQFIHKDESKWRLYKYGEKNPDEYQLPSEMFMVITQKRQTSVKFDYFEYSIGGDVKFVSELFLAYIRENGLDASYYEIAKLNIVNLEGDLLTDDNYFALRFIKYDDDLFVFPQETKKRAAGTSGNCFLYPDIALKNINNRKSVFVLNSYPHSFCYMNAILLNDSAKEYILNNFYAPEIYKAKDFPYIWNNSYRWEVLPVNNEYRVKNNEQ